MDGFMPEPSIIRWHQNPSLVFPYVRPGAQGYIFIIWSRPALSAAISSVVFFISAFFRPTSWPAAKLDKVLIWSALLVCPFMWFVSSVLSFFDFTSFWILVFFALWFCKRRLPRIRTNGYLPSFRYKLKLIFMPSPVLGSRHFKDKIFIIHKMPNSLTLEKYLILGLFKEHDYSIMKY